MGKYRQKKSASPESERHVQVMSNCVYSCLSLISILRGNLLGFAGLNRCISLGEKSFVFVLFQSGPVLIFKCGVVGFQGEQ